MLKRLFLLAVLAAVAGLGIFWWLTIPAVVNAIVEGLWREYKIDHIDMPATAERVWIAIREAQRRHNL